MKWIIGAIIIIFVFAGVWFFAKKSASPLPAKFYPSEGREHVAIGTKVKYKTNPPTSGNHFADWTHTGVYDKPWEDGYLVHSLEHGYIIISYNCMKDNSKSGTDSAALSDPAWSSKSCKDLKKQLSDFANEEKLWKLIVIPRPNMDTKIALTAWARLDKMDIFDKVRAQRFIDAFRDHGPEQTME